MDTERLLEGDTRTGTGKLTYPRPVDPDPYLPFGPSALGEWWWPVAISPDRRTVFSSLIPPPGVEPSTLVIGQQVRLQRTAEQFAARRKGKGNV